ncbi:DUF302 domain-containing protein [Natronorarus salvus]|uniref:DUF302 domain-containing protein n=1 Tax=Natronorarus salvus TaxID=3117733 RepID=UPI002F26312F
MTRTTDDGRRTVLKIAGATAGAIAGLAGFGQVSGDEHEEDDTEHGDDEGEPEGDEEAGSDPEGAGIERGAGLVTVDGGETVAGTVERIEAAIEDGPPQLVATIDHAANAETVGEELRETTLILSGAPELGTPVMQESQTAGIDLPQKLLVWCDEHGEVRVTYNDPLEVLVARHEVPEIEAMNEALAGFAAAGAGE